MKTARQRADELRAFIQRYDDSMRSRLERLFAKRLAEFDAEALALEQDSELQRRIGAPGEVLFLKQ